MMFGLDNVTAGYGDKEVLHGCSLTLAPRGITVLTGPSGRGKTTVLRLLAGLESPRSGTVHAPKSPAVLFQENRLFPHRTVLEQITDVLPRQRRDEGNSWLELAQLTGDAEELPAALSGGMARRLALARAMALGGDCLLLDEPFTGVDPLRRARFLERLADWPVPILLITHDPLEQSVGTKTISL